MEFQKNITAGNGHCSGRRKSAIVASDAASIGSSRSSRRPTLPAGSIMVNGRDQDFAPTNVFLSDDFSDRYRPGSACLIYAASCPGLDAIGAALRVPLAEIGTCAPEAGLERLMFEHYRDRTGAYRRQGPTYIRDEAGWRGWSLIQFDPIYGPSPHSPAGLRENAVVVRLPEGMQDFDERFNDEVWRSSSIAMWANTEAAADHCRAVGLDQSALQRYTRCLDGSMRAEVGICALSPLGGADRLIRIAERVIAEHLGISAAP